MEEKSFGDLLNEKLTGFGYIADPETYELMYINVPLLQRVRPKSGQWEGKKCFEIIHRRTAPCTFCNMKKNLEQDSMSWYHHNEAIDAHFVVNDFIVEKGNKSYFLQTSHEITQQVREIIDLKAMAAADKAVIACANTLLKGAEAISELLQIIMTFFEGDYAYIFERDTLSHTTRISYSVRCSRNIPLKEADFEKCYPYEDDSSWTQELMENPYVFLQAFELEDSSFPYRDSFFTNHDNSNFLMAPLMVNGNLIGVLGVNNLKKNISYLSLITTVTAFISNSLSIKYTHEDLEESVNNFESRNTLNQAILDCVTTLVHDKKLEEAIEKLLAIICRYFQGKGAYILSEITEKECLYCQYFHVEVPSLDMSKTPEDPVWIFREIYENHCLPHSDVAHISSVTDSLEGKYPQKMVDFIKNRGVNQFLLVPLCDGKRSMGYIWVDEPLANLSDISLLSTISTFVVNHINKDQLLKRLEQLSYTDTLTGLYNRNFFNHYTEHLQQEGTKQVGIIFADVNGLKKANDNFGHELGDILLTWSGHFFKKNTDGSVFRIGGDEFVCFMEGISQDKFQKCVEELLEKLEHYGDVHISVGHSWVEKVGDVNALIKETDEKMYVEKQKYYKKKSQDARSVSVELSDFSISILALKKEIDPL